ncbi:MAG: cysteine desulfurase [Endomicrobiales bacterium]|nr:cysteine desulfurase [Endomicrobiales bacterium]
MTKKRVYLDHSATTPMDTGVFEAMKPFLGEIFANPSSVHSFGQEAKKHLEEARDKIAEILNAESSREIIFTSCGTESNNLAVKGAAGACSGKGGHVITSSIEHHAVLNPCEHLQKNGFEITLAEAGARGTVDPEKIMNAVTDRTVMISVMFANNETGAVQPVKELGRLIAEKNEERAAKKLPKIVFHTDAVQAAGKLKIDAQELGVDFLSISAHKFYGPKGVGCLYVRRGAKLEPLLHGGHHERNLRAGTENLAGIVGMAKALELAVLGMPKEQERLAELRDKFEKSLKKEIPEVTINAAGVERLSSVTSASFSCVEGEALLLSLDLEGIACSTGSACASGSLEPSHVLKAMGVDPALAQGTLRFSFGHGNTEDDVDYVMSVLPAAVEKLRKMSPIWKNRKTAEKK